MQVVMFWQATRNSSGVLPHPVRVVDGLVIGPDKDGWDYWPHLPLERFKQRDNWLTASLHETREQALAEYRAIETARIEAAKAALAAVSEEG